MKMMFRFTKPKHDLDIDIRFMLANERTLLAWIRTALAIIAGGAAVTFISPLPRYGLVMGLGAIVFGGVCAVIGYVRYHIADQAIRRHELPPVGFGGLLGVIGVVVFAAAIALTQAFGLK